MLDKLTRGQNNCAKTKMTVMKRIILIAITLLIPICMFAQGGGKKQAYRIRRISNRGDCYVIRASRNDSLFLIIGEKYSNNPTGEKLRVGKSYVLDLKQIFPVDSLFGMPFAPNLGVVGIGLSDGSKLSTSRRYHRAIYSAKNLDGKHLMDNKSSNNGTEGR